MEKRNQPFGLGWGGTLLPVYWQRWSAYRIEAFEPQTPTERVLADWPPSQGGIPLASAVFRREGDLKPYRLDNRGVTTFLRTVMETAPVGDLPNLSSPVLRRIVAEAARGLADEFDPEIVASVVNRRTQDFATQWMPHLVATLLVAFGPLFPLPAPLSEIDLVPPSDVGEDDVLIPLLPVERPPDVVSVVGLFAELRFLRLGLLAAQAIRGEDDGSLQADAAALLKQIHNLAPEWLREGHRAVLTLGSLQAAAMGSGPGGARGELQAFVRHWALRSPARLRVDLASGSLVPVASSPAQVAWLAIAHETGALRLPGGGTDGPLIRFCAECGRAVFSTRPRRRGEHVFCDPPPGESRSVCGNRFHSRRGKARRSTRSAGKGGDKNGQAE